MIEQRRAEPVACRQTRVKDSWRSTGWRRLSWCVATLKDRFTMDGGLITELVIAS